MRAAPLFLLGISLVGVAISGCGRKPDNTLTLSGDGGGAAPRRDEPPVALDPETPVRYPPALFQQRISGTVLLIEADQRNGAAPPLCG
jgi:hypothetical protein